MVMVVIPRPGGQPMSCSRVTNIKRPESPRMTSGITSGAATMPAKSMRVRNRVKRTSVSAASVPRITDRVAVIAATRTDSQRAARMRSFCRSSTYHRVEKPPQTVTRRESLKE